MNTSDLQTIYDYNYWANGRILAAAAQLSQEQFVAIPASSGGSMRGTIVHVLDAEYAWRMLLQHKTLDHFRELKADDFPTVAALAERWREDEQSMRAWLATLTDADLAGTIRYTTDEGGTRERVLWHCLWHVVNHGTQHRSEAAVLLTDYGCSPGGLDFTAFLNELV
ncbi:MAG: DinB family protein [Caldilineaceae bacterium]|nr:DinB family protein [Caldilineaceae bacterium]